MREGRTLFLYPIGEIVHIEPFKEGRSDAAIVFLELPKSKKKRKWNQCESQFTEIAGNYGIKKLTSPATVGKLRNMLGSALT